MKIDELGCLVMEHSSPEGNLGDSCAETARLFHMCVTLFGNDPYFLELKRFRTDIGYVRHPNAEWRENDFSSDQALPLYLCFHSTLYSARHDDDVEMYNRIKAAGWKTGNRTFVNPGFYALLKKNQWLINSTLAAQAWIFKIPFRWNDKKKWFEKSSGSSCDYLNWIHSSIYAYPWVRNMVSKETLKTKVRDYYSIEPNSDWVVHLYDRLIDEYFYF